MGKKKLLWVVFDFVQAGGQRYVYEITKALNKEKYEIDFLKIGPLNYDKNWDDEFYYTPTLNMGHRIFLFDNFVPKTPVKKQKSLSHRSVHFLLRKLHLDKLFSKEKGLHPAKNYDKLRDFLFSYDSINFSGSNVYKALISSTEIELPHAVIHILTSRFQEPNLYSGLDKKKFYNFVSGMQEGSIKAELAEFENYKFTHFNLNFDPFPYQIQMTARKNRYQIAVFTRLSRMKPLDPYFYALKILREQGINIELLVYGAGNPDEVGYSNQVGYLYLKSDVKFMGHIDDIPKLLRKTAPDLIWFQAANSQPAGYAALEISMSGLPQVFWDFMYLGHNDELKEVFPSFTEILPFVAFTRRLLESHPLRSELGQKQRDYVLKEYSIKDNIQILENLFDK